MIDIDNDVAFDSGFVNMPCNESVLMDTDIPSSGKFKGIWGMMRRWETKHIITGVVNAGFNAMEHQSKLV